MSTNRFGHWHGVAVTGTGDDIEHDILHADSCRWSTHFHPRVVDRYGNILYEAFYEQEYTCDVGWTLRENGPDGFPTAEGFYWLRLEHIVHPGGPWGDAEYDTGMQWRRVERPLINVRNAEAEA